MIEGGRPRFSLPRRGHATEHFVSQPLFANLEAA